MAARRFFGIRISPEGYAAIKALADEEMDGNASEMARVLLSEALAARRSKRLTPRLPKGRH